jgi:Transglycosylase SLT domain
MPQVAVDLDQRFIGAHAAVAPAHQHPTGSVRQAQGQVIRMVTSLVSDSVVVRNNTLRHCLIFALAVPVFSAAPVLAQQGHLTTVVQADVKTGRLVRSFVMEPKVVAARVVQAQMVGDPQASGPDATTENLKDMIDRIAAQEGVETLVHSVIRAESNYNANAVSPRGALGIMQLIPATARRFGVSNTFDAKENIQGGVRYLRFLLDYYQGDYPKTIAAYNAGEGAVDKYHGIPPYAETQNYVYQVARNLKAARQAAGQKGEVKEAGLKPAPAINGETSALIQASTGSDGRIYYRTP